MTKNKYHKYDIAVIGAGTSGLGFAKALEGSDLSIAIIDIQNKNAISSPEYDGREIAITHHTKKIMEELDIWNRISKDEISLIKNANVLDGESTYSLSFSHTQSNTENLGFVISNHLLRKAAYESLKILDNVDLFFDTSVTNVTCENEFSKTATISLDNGEKITAGLVIAADSRFSKTRGMMGIKTSITAYGRDCIVCKMKYDGEPIDTAYECFHYDRTLAVLPLNDNYCSVVITEESDKSEKILNMDTKEFAKDIQLRMQGNAALENLTLSSELFKYPLTGIYARKFYANRYALIGDAAVGMHPVTAHGYNLGLQGAYTLAKEIKKAHMLGIDFGSKIVLSLYNKKHQKSCLPLYYGTNAVVSIYTNNSKIAKAGRKAMLRIGNILPPAKRLIIRQLTESDIDI